MDRFRGRIRMHKYNVSTNNHWAWFLAAALTAGCAGQPPAPTGSEPENASGGVEARAPEAEESRQRDFTGDTRSQSSSVPLREDAPLRYVVEKGDTLWDIAEHFLRDPWYWPELWYANPEIDNPHLIYPGDVLELVWVDGRPQLRRAEKLSPRVRELPLASAVPTIPIEAIRQFLQGPRLVTEQELAQAPYVVQFLDEHLMGGEGNHAYIRGADPADGRNLNIVRPGEPYLDPDSGELLGYEAIPVGRVELQAFDDEIGTALISRSYREALIGDRLLPLDESVLTTDFQPHAPAREVKGRIISVYDGVGEIGQYAIVTLNRGTRENIEPGHVLDIYKNARRASDPVAGGQVTLPPVKAGTLLVFKAEDRVSFALVMRATRSINVLDRVRTPD